MAKKKATKAEKRYFKGVWIPASLWACGKLKDINQTQRDLLIEIDSLTGSESACYAQNAHFEEMFKKGRACISSNISELVKKGLVNLVLNKHLGNKRWLVLTPKAVEEYLKRDVYPVEIEIEKCLNFEAAPIPEKSDSLSEINQIPMPEKSDSLSEINQIPIPEKSDSLSEYKEENTNYNTNENTNKNTNKEKHRKISENELELELEKAKQKAAEFELELFKIIPPQTKGQRVTYRRLFDHVAKQISQGQLTGVIFNKLLAAAKDARRDGDNPRAMWMSKAKKLTGFEGQGKQFKKQSFDEKRKKQLDALGVAK